MFTLNKDNVIRTQVFVPQDEAFGLQPGVSAVVHVPEMPDRSFPGTVTRIADALQPGSRTLLTEIDIPNPDGALSAGIYCTVNCTFRRKVPSLLDSGRRHHLQCQRRAGRGGRERRRPHPQDRGGARSRHGGRGARRRQPGDQVILNPSVDLVDGAKVQVAANPSGSAAAAGPYGTK